jgi:hypothetical protein
MENIKAILADKFPTAFYQDNGALTCPNGDKVRSDEEGLFCWLEGQRVPYPVVELPVPAAPVPVPADAFTVPDAGLIHKPSSKKKAGDPDANG